MTELDSLGQAGLLLFASPAAVRMATEAQLFRKELNALTGIVKPDSSSDFAGDFTEWLKGVPLSWREGMSFCLRRAALRKPMPWE